MKPNLLGTYETSKDFETIRLKIEDGKLNIYYKTRFDAWKETVLFAFDMRSAKASIKYSHLLEIIYAKLIFQPRL